MPGPGLIARRAARRVRDGHRARQAARQVAALPHADVVVCWDLDNTLVDTGVLIRAGRPLHEAAAVAEPMAGMLEFARTVHAALPGATHVAISHRDTALRPATLTWLTAHEVPVAPDAVVLVPRARDKVPLWAALAARSRLLVVDDLSHGHERPEPVVYPELTAAARRTAEVYVGIEEIEAVRADPSGAAERARRAVAPFLGSKG